MKVTDLIISAIMKKGVAWEARKFEADVRIPDTNIVINIKSEHMTVRVEKDDKNGS